MPEVMKRMVDKRVFVTILLVFLIIFFLLWGTVFYAVNRGDEVRIHLPGGEILIIPHLSKDR